MSTAFVSGSLGRAIFLADGVYYTKDVDVEARPTSGFELGEIDARYSDFDVVEVPTESSIEDVLDEAVAIEQVQFLLLSSINPELSFNTRLICAQSVDPLLHKAIQDNLLRRLLSATLPSEVYSNAINTLNIFVTFTNLSAVLREVFESQECVAAVTSSIDRVLIALPATDKQDIRAEFIHQGVFSSLVRGLRSKDAHRLNQAVVSALLALREATEGSVAEEAARSLGSALGRLLPSSSRQRSLRLEQPKADESSRKRRHQSVEELISSDPLLGLSKISPFAAKTAVDKQLAGISTQILQGRSDLVERYVTQLVQFQLNNSEREHLAKSLCLLTSVALAANQLDIADTLSNYAVQLGVNDEVVYTSRAEVFKYKGLFDAALMHYRNAKLRFSEASYAWNGEAEVLKEAARYDEALAAYKTALARFPDDPVPHNGYVSTLRRMGRLSDALREARKVVHKFNDDPVSRTELGNILTASGRYYDAIREYRTVLSFDPKQVRSRMAYARALNALGERTKALDLLQAAKRWNNGPLIRTAIANQYRVMGLLDKALEVAKSVTMEYPGYTPGRFALAAILLLLGDVVEAAEYLPKDKLRSASDWQGYRTYLLCLLTSSNSKDALTRIQQAEKQCGWFDQKSRIATTLAVAYARAGDTKSATSILQDSNGIEDHQKQTRMALLGAVNSQCGRPDLAKTIFTRILSTKDPSIIRFKTAYLSGGQSSVSVIPLLLAA